MKNKYSVWYNRFGVDECYGEVESDKFDKNVLKMLSKEFDILDGVELDDFDVEVEGENWTMYEYDGIGILEVRGGRSIGRCKKEYDVIID